MPLIAEAEIVMVGPVEAIFADFVDYRTWAGWMPPVFRPLYGPPRQLRRGDRLIVKVGGALPSLITVDRLESPREVCWSGGIPGLMFARHTFIFDAVGKDSTRIRSVEPWSGLTTLVKPLADSILRAAQAGGRAQLRGFDRWFQAQRPARAA
jgi:hypothetical protein